LSVTGDLHFLREARSASDDASSSLGEYVAQTVAGVLTLQDALLLVANRARLMVQKCAPASTGMMAINLGAVAIGKILASSSGFSDITIACYNSPDDHVVSGPVAGLQALKSYLDVAVRCKSFLLPVGFGLHSGAMSPLQDELTLLAERITISPPVIPIISNVYGKLVLPGDAAVFDAQYYSRHCTEPVLFDQGIRGSVTIDSFPVIDAWIEIGPRATILPSLRRQTVIQKDALFLASMWKRQDPLASLHGALARLYVSPLAFEIKWRKVFSYLPFVSNVSLPTYHWSNASFWVGFKEEMPPTYKTNPLPGPNAREPGLPYAVLHACIQSPFAGHGNSFVFETPMSHLSKLICGHRVRELPLCPASTYQELALAGVEASILFHHSAFKNRFVVLHDIDFQSPLVYSEGSCYAIQTSIVFETENAGSWKVITTNDGEKIHAHGGFQLQRPPSTISRFSVIYPVVSHRVAAITSRRDGKIFTTSSVYQVIFPRVVTYGKNYRVVRTLTISAEGTEGYATVQLPNNADRDGFVVHPILMDAMLHVAGFIANMCGGANDAFICSKVGCVEVIPRLIDDSAPYGVYVNCAWLPGGDMLAESYTLERDRIVAHFEGIHFRKVPLTTLEHGLTLAAGPGLSEPLKSEAFSSGFPLTPPAEIKPGVVLSKSRSRAGSVLLSPGVAKDSFRGAGSSALFQSRHGHDIEAATVGNALEMPRINPDFSLPSSSTLVEQFSDAEDDACQSDVKGLLAAVLGLEVKELREDADLELLGLDSLASIEAHHALQSHFAMLLPSDLFTTHTSASAVESFITGRLLASCQPHSDNTDTAARPTAVHPDPAADCPETLLVSVQRTRLPGRAPLLLIHDGSGLVSYIRNLPSLGRDLWGIHNPYFIEGRPWESVVSMAAEYAKYTIEAGLGPVILGGWNLVSSEILC
jgi:iterative type I PKS product template protein